MATTNRMAAVMLAGACLLGCDKQKKDDGSSPATTMHYQPITAGDPVPVEDLCRALFGAYMRWAAVYQTIGADNAGPECPPLLTDDEFVQTMGDLDWYYWSACKPGGTIAVPVEALARMVSDGRLRYDPRAAGQLVTEGRSLVAHYGGLGGLYAGVDAGPIDTAALSQLMANVVAGMVAEGGSCLADVECAAAGGARLFCVLEDGRSCGSACRQPGGEGAACGPGKPPCATGTLCDHTGGVRQGQCVAATPRAAGTVCAEDGGTYPCETDLRCIQGTCQALGDVGTACSSTSDCRSSLRCTGSRCQALSREGMPCYYTSDCIKCLACEATGGGRRCTRVASEGESCAVAHCRAGLACVDGVCARRPRAGEPCTMTDAGETMLGSCLSARQACLGAPATCAARAAAGQACVSAPGTRDTVGSCDNALFCRRSNTDAGEGTCAAAPAVGEACGSAVGMFRSCQEGAACVSTSADASVCVPQPRPAGTPCNYTSECDKNLTCAGDAGHHACMTKATVGQPCLPDVGCVDGFCDYFRQNGSFGHFCSPYPPAGTACTTSTQCGSESRCVDGGCVNGLGTECGGSATCPGELACEDGLCVKPDCASARSSASCAGGLPSYLLYAVTIVGGAKRWKRKRPAR